MKPALVAQARIGKQWHKQVAEHLPPIQFAILPEFSGPGGGYSPEEIKKLRAIKDCAVSNSIKTGKTFKINIS